MMQTVRRVIAGVALLLAIATGIAATTVATQYGAAPGNTIWG